MGSNTIKQFLENAAMNVVALIIALLLLRGAGTLAQSMGGIAAHAGAIVFIGALIGLLLRLRLGGDKQTSGAIGAVIMTMAVVGLIGWAWWIRAVTHVGWKIWLLFAVALVFAAVQTVVNRRRMAKEL